MKKLSIFIIFYCTLYSYIWSQDTANSLIVHDTRSIVDSPNFITQKIRADFKFLSTLGIPESNGVYSTNITISPWVDVSGGLIHQLNFNDGGVFYRNGAFSSSWNGWKKLIQSDLNGNIEGDMGITGDLYLGGNPGICNGYGNKLYLRGVGDQNDDIVMAKYSLANNQTEFRIILGDDALGDDKFTIGNHKYNESTWYPFFTVQNDGKIGIKNHFPKYEFDVNGTIRAREILVNIDAGADHVFHPEYELTNLSDLKSFVEENKHLPDIPSEQQMQENGLNVNEFQIKLLQKIEELTLYTIQQQTLIENMQKEIIELKSNSNH